MALPGAVAFKTGHKIVAASGALVSRAVAVTSCAQSLGPLVAVIEVRLILRSSACWFVGIATNAIIRRVR
jgi:hypothetical protein